MQYNMYQEYNLNRNAIGEIWVIMEFNFLSLSDQQLIKLSDAIRRESSLDTNIKNICIFQLNKAMQYVPGI